MKIPSKLKIGGHLVTVDCSQELKDDCANWDGKTGIIVIDKRLTQSQKESALLHEILHVCNAVVGDTDIFHALQDSLSEQLYQVLKDNKLHF